MSKPLFRRPCKRCDRLFTPTGKSCRVCDECVKKVPKKLREKLLNDEKLKVEYFAKKVDLDKLRDDITLERWKILSANYKLGKKIWKNSFSRNQLAIDMGMAYTTVLRCLALDKATKRSWDLVKEGKLSVFKLAMICALKNNTYQDKTVDLVMKTNLSTYKIKKLHIDNIEDIDKERHRIAIEEGYSNRESAYYNLKQWIDRGERFMIMSVDQIRESQRLELNKHLLRLNKKIDSYSKKLLLKK